MFLHGWGCSHKTLMPIVKTLKDNYKCICVDFFGHGESCEMPYPLTIFDFAFGVIKILKNLGIDQCSIIAHSFGARVAFILASQKEVIIDKMVLFGPAGMKPKFSLRKWWLKMEYKIAKKLTTFGWYSKEHLNNWGSPDYKRLSPIMKNTFSKVVNCDLKLLLPLIKANTLIVVGANDKETPPYMARKINKGIKDSQLIVVEDTGHFCFLEKNNLIRVAKCFLKC